MIIDLHSIDKYGSSSFCLVLVVITILSCGNHNRNRSDDNVHANTSIKSYSELNGFADKDIIRLMERVSELDSMTTVKEFSDLIAKASGDSTALQRIDEVVENCLEDPNSPMRNEGLYICYLNSLVRSSGIPSYMRERASDRLGIVSKNRPGMIATDFRYVDRHGKRHSLHSTPADMLLLVFFDPECSHCTAILEMLIDDAQLSAQLKDGTIKVLAIYAEGKNDVWEKSKNDLPREWIVGKDDNGILEHELYDLPAMPTIYLLDSRNRVILKDPSVANLQDALLKQQIAWQEK